MADRQRYWKLEPSEVEKFAYNESKMINWEIKCVKDDGVSFVGVFAYRHGIPLGYESVMGIGIYHNYIGDAERGDIVQMIKKKHGGNAEDHSNRTLVRDATMPYSGAEICALAQSAESIINGKSIITLEFEGLTEDEQQSAGLPPTKLLPIPGAHNGA